MAKDMSRDNFFRQETQATLDAIKRRTLKIAGSLKTAGGLSPWIQQRPFTSVLAAAFGGLVTGYLIVPPRPQPPVDAPPEPAHGHRAPTIGEKLEAEAFRAVRPALRSFAATAAGALVARLSPLSQHAAPVAPAAAPEIPSPSASSKHTSS